MEKHEAAHEEKDVDGVGGECDRDGKVDAMAGEVRDRADRDEVVEQDQHECDAAHTVQDVEMCTTRKMNVSLVSNLTP
ncbi:MAG: hypothetical protein NVS1B2_12740 [Vulcanimicrobiaceae bacterium]